MNYIEESGDTLSGDKDLLNDLFLGTNNIAVDDPDGILAEPAIVDINLDEIDSEAEYAAVYLTEKLANYYLDINYIENHPYIKPKIRSEISNIRRLQKMLLVNEKAQDSLIKNIACNAGKGALYSALTSLQQATLNIQKQLDDLTNELENIFQKMQDECKVTFDSKEKEVASDGSMVSRGSKDFIREITAKLYGEKTTLVNTETGEIISETTNYRIEETPKQ